MLVLMNQGDVIFKSQKEREPQNILPGRSGLSSAVQSLLASYRTEQEKQEAGATQETIRVGEVLGSIAFVYERIRNAIEYKDEHLLRRSAIERILRRQFWERPSRDPEVVAKSLIRELIWARYLKNDTLPKSKIKETAKTLIKYRRLLGLILTGQPYEGQVANEWRKWLVGIVSCEIEEALSSSLFYVDALSEAMYTWFRQNFNWQDDQPSSEEKEIQIFIAVYRSLPKADDPRLRYYLLKRLYPDWKRASDELIKKVAEDLFATRREIEQWLDFPRQRRLYRFVQKHTTPFQILRNIIEGNPRSIQEIIVDPKRLEEKIREICHHRYAQIGERVNRGVLRSVIYIFVTKVLLAIIMEVPYELYVVEEIKPLPLAMNILFPPALMFLVGLTIRRPDEANTERIVSRLKGFIYSKAEEEKMSFSLVPVKRGWLTERIFFVIYGLLSLLIFGGIAYGLFKLHFNIVSAVIFFVFLSLVLLFGFRVRFIASEIIVTGKKEGLLSHLLTNLSLPLLNLGVWLSEILSQLNFLMILMDFLIEAPLKSIIEVVEEWTSFIRERREEVVEVPVR